MKHRNIVIAGLLLMLILLIGVGQVWVGIGYLEAKSGGSAVGGAAIGGLGVLDSATWGWAFAVACGGPAGIAAGIIAGA